MIPAFDEEAAIGRVVTELKRVLGDRVGELLVIDDGSRDRTAEAAAAAGARVLSNGANRGYGASLKRGIREAKGEWVLTLDADGQHRAADALRLLEAADGFDMVVGRRARLLHSPLWRMPGKWLLTALAEYLCQREIPDLNCGLRVLRRAAAERYLHVCPSGFSFSTTMTMALLTRGQRVAFVPIEVNERIGVSRVTLRTGLETIILVLRLAALFNPLRLFVPASLACAAVGALWGLPYALWGRGLSVGALLALVTAVVLFALGLICDQVSALRLERFE